MRITDRNLTGAPPIEAGQAQEIQKPESGGSSPAASRSDSTGDRVELSGALAQLSKVMAASESGRASRVQSLAAQYQSGRYQPSSAATSRAMVNELLAAGTQ